MTEQFSRILIWSARILAFCFAGMHLFAVYFLRGSSGAASTSVQSTLVFAMMILGLSVPSFLRKFAARLLFWLAVAIAAAYCAERIFSLLTFYQGPDMRAIAWVATELAVVAVIGIYASGANRASRQTL